jgi:hypothetical protein
MASTKFQDSMKDQCQYIPANTIIYMYQLKSYIRQWTLCFHFGLKLSMTAMANILVEKWKISVALLIPDLICPFSSYENYFFHSYSLTSEEPLQVVNIWVTAETKQFRISDQFSYNWS